MEDSQVGSEVSALKRKLKSKTEALLILSEELNKCRIERDQFKIVIDRFHILETQRKVTPLDERGVFSGFYAQSSQTKDTRERNAALTLEIEDLKQKLQEAYGDIKVLRKARLCHHCNPLTLALDEQSEWKEEMIRKMEELASRADAAERALRESDDSRAEVEQEANSLRKVNANLRTQLATSLIAAAQGKPIDLDSLIMENKYIQERLDQALAEKDLCQQTLTKYKAMLDKRKSKGNVKLGSRTSNCGMIVTHKQVQELLEGKNESWEMTEATVADLRSLSMALLEALQDKSLAFSHQKKANKILANRVNELESRLGPTLSLLQSSSVTGSFDQPTGCYSEVKEEEENSRTISENSLVKSEIESLDEKIAVASGPTEETLPPDLQNLVIKAMLEIKQTTHSLN